MHESLSATIGSAAKPSGDGGTLSIDLAATRLIASDMDVQPLLVEIAALENGVVPTRYVRNIGTIGIEGQLKLLRSCVGVCGLGGLGGHIAVSLARFGIGRLILVDGDVFEEDNLNRQELCQETDLGRPKAEVAAERISAINSALDVIACQRFVDAGNIVEVFSGANMVMDALDTVSSRLTLENGCAQLSIPMVHGAIAGDSGQVMAIFPGDPGLRAIYTSGDDRGAEMIVGNPPTTPALVAALQVNEAVKILCGGEPLRHGFLLVDITTNLYQFIPLK
ncbi:MAG: HesA/MoeB/ThiF family protein [Actinobacteria bacterium]|nr:HesA/MoeB/ThiF family protein [Actinomycetota bacterium]